MGLMGIPEVLAGALDTTTMVAALILSMLILTTVAMILAALDAGFIPIAIIVFGLSAVLTAMGWLNQWFIIIAVLLVCAGAGIRFATATTGGSD